MVGDLYLYFFVSHVSWIIYLTYTGLLSIAFKEKSFLFLFGAENSLKRFNSPWFPDMDSQWVPCG